MGNSTRQIPIRPGWGIDTLSQIHGDKMPSFLFLHHRMWITSSTTTVSVMAQTNLSGKIISADMP
jgi:hypothetical protein